MDDCTSLDPENHTMVLLESKQANLWVGRMENHKSGCHHRVFARLISTSTWLSDTAKEKIEKLRVRSKWLDHVCAFHGTKSLIGHGTFLLMEEYKESLQTKLQRDGRLTSEEIQRYGSDIICGVRQLHNAGIVCMDIKPSTILLDEKERAHISGYGITSTEKDLSVDDTYAAPETWKCSNENERLFSKASDVWSLGCTILVMCSGMFLWDGDSETEMLEYLQQRILPLNLDDLEEPLFSIIRDCLQYEAEKRPTLNEIQEKFLCNREHINPLLNPLRIHELPTDENKSPSGDGGENYGEDDSDGSSEALPRERDVLLACEKGSLEDLEKLFELGPNLGDGRALCVAVSLKQLHEKEGRPGKTIVQSLLGYGINLSCKDDLGQNPLHIAAGMNDVEVVNILMNAGANVNIRNIENETPIHVALKNCAGLPCIETLLQRGASHTLQDNDGNNALHIAAQAALSCKNLDAMSMMLKFHGSSAPPAVNAKNYRGYTLEDLLKRLPKNMISQELKSILEKEGIDLHGEGDSLEGERDQSDSGPHGKHNALDIADLEDADMAGGIKSLDCTLILTEGQTAKKFATCGRNLLGRDIYGSYTLCGKLINAYGKTSWSQNVQVQSIFAALGLKLAVGRHRYVFDKKNLRYGHVLMMMDQDSDGNHIRGLLINMFHCLCPELLKVPMFLQDFRTNLYKVINTETKETKSFIFLNDYRTWSLGNRQGEWTTKYLKGIASNSDEEVKKYFEHFEDHIRYFVWHGVIDANYIERAFSRFSKDDRKKWVLEHEGGLYDTSPSSGDRMISYHEFIQKDLVPYFDDSVKRSIPSMMDGQKISQRKIMFTMLKEAGSKEKFVSTLAGLVSDCTAYHHRQTSLESTIISMAQDFCGTNNLNLLKPEGLFGSRNEGPCISPKAYPYLKVEISPIARLIFRKEDNDLLDRDREDGKEVQPKWYAPIFPLILVNGASGVACGFNTSVLSYDVNNIIRNLERLMESMATEEMIPSYRDFKGTVAKGKDSNSYTITGKWDLDDTRTTLTIFELPVGVWYTRFEEDLQAMKTANLIKSFEIINKGLHGEAIHGYKILLTVALDNKTIESEFKLKKTVSSHIYLYNVQGRLRYYTSPDEVLHDFYIERLKIYEKRKDDMIKEGLIPPHVTAKDLWKKDLEEFKETYNK